MQTLPDYIHDPTGCSWKPGEVAFGEQPNPELPYPLFVNLHCRFVHYSMGAAASLRVAVCANFVVFPRRYSTHTPRTLYNLSAFDGFKYVELALLTQCELFPHTQFDLMVSVVIMGCSTSNTEHIAAVREFIANHFSAS